MIRCYWTLSLWSLYSGCSRLCIRVGLSRFTWIKTTQWFENWDYTRNSWRRRGYWSHIVNQGCCFTPGTVGICGGRGLIFFLFPKYIIIKKCIFLFFYNGCLKEIFTGLLSFIVFQVSLPSFSLGLPAYYILASSEASSNLSRYDGVRWSCCN